MGAKGRGVPEAKFTAAEAGEFCGVSRQAIYQHIASGVLKPDKYLNGSPLFTRATLEAYRRARLADMKAKVSELEHVIRST